MIRLIIKFRNQSLQKQALFAFAFLVLYVITSNILENSYTASLFPVPYFEQQTSFNSQLMKQWYAFMLAQDTMGIYLTTQFIDFAFIAVVANFHQKGSLFRKVGQSMAFALPLAGLFDILENLMSFPMIFNPRSFSDWLIIPYSTFASIKFGFWVIALLWLGISLIASLLVKLYSLINRFNR